MLVGETNPGALQERDCMDLSRIEKRVKKVKRVKRMRCNWSELSSWKLKQFVSQDVSVSIML